MTPEVPEVPETPTTRPKMMCSAQRSLEDNRVDRSNRERAKEVPFTARSRCHTAVNERHDHVLRPESFVQKQGYGLISESRLAPKAGRQAVLSASTCVYKATTKEN
jgi:hypothetical protein